MTGRRAARPRRPPWAPISNPACGRDRCRSSGSLYTSPCLIDCLLRSRSIHTTPRRLSAQSYRVAPADHPVVVPEKHGSTGKERPKTRFLANNFGNGGPMFGPLCRIMRNYTADIFTIDLAGYSYRWRKFSQVGQTYHWYTWDLYVRTCSYPTSDFCTFRNYWVSSHTSNFSKIGQSDPKIQRWGGGGGCACARAEMPHPTHDLWKART